MTVRVAGVRSPAELGTAVGLAAALALVGRRRRLAELDRRIAAYRSVETSPFGASPAWIAAQSRRREAWLAAVAAELGIDLAEAQRRFAQAVP